MWPFEAPCQWYLQSLSNVLDPAHTVLNDEQRREACSFIYRVSRHLHFPLRTCFTAQLYFHRFFARHPHKADDYVAPMDIALTCLLVAAKAEETYLRIRQILAGAFLVLNPDWQQQQQQGGQTREVLIVEQHRARVVQYEHRVLEAIEYNFVVRHAHEVLAKLIGTCNADSETDVDTNSDVKKGKISAIEASAAFVLLQRIYETPLVLCYPPEIIAVSALNIACSQEKVKIWIVKKMGFSGALKNDQLMAPLMTKLREFAAMIKEQKRSSPPSSTVKDESSLEASRSTKRNRSN